jgi:hypothetical protein
MLKTASSSGASHGTRRPGSNSRFQYHDRRRTSAAGCHWLPQAHYCDDGEREAAICSISVAELAHGIHWADTPERRQFRRTFLDDLKATVPVYPINGGHGRTRRRDQRRNLRTRHHDPLRRSADRGLCTRTRLRRCHAQQASLRKDSPTAVDFALAASLKTKTGSHLSLSSPRLRRPRGARERRGRWT